MPEGIPADGPLVLHANVLISRIISPGRPAARLVDWALLERDIVVSQPLLTELNAVLSRPKFSKYIDPEGRLAFLAALTGVAKSVELTETVVACRDPADDHILSLALSAKSRLIVSGDRDLLVLHPFRDVSILRPMQVLAAVAGDRET